MTGCTPPTASPHCANNPTQADLLYPQVGVIAMNPENGGHSSMPVLGVPIPETAGATLPTATPQKKDLLIVSSEDTANNCFGQAPHDAWILDITNEVTPWPMATLNVPHDPGDFCDKGARFGAHAVTEAIYPPYLRKDRRRFLVQCRRTNMGHSRPENPLPIAYYIQAPNRTPSHPALPSTASPHCHNATMNDYVEFDDRGYIYAADRAGTGVTILSLTGDALKVVAPAGPAQAH